MHGQMSVSAVLMNTQMDLNEIIHEWTNEGMDGWMDEYVLHTDGWLDEWMTWDKVGVIGGCVNVG